MKEIKNAKIEYTMLGLEDHGIFTATVGLDYGGSGQGFGQYCLKGEAAYVFISRVLEVVGCEQWEHLPGKPCRVEAEHSKVHKIGHYLRDEWFDPVKEFEKLKKEKETP